VASGSYGAGAQPAPDDSLRCITASFGGPILHHLWRRRPVIGSRGVRSRLVRRL